MINTILKEDRKQGIIVDSNHLLFLKQSSNGTFNHPTLNEKLLDDHLSFIFSDRNNFMFEIFDQKIFQLVESGIATKNVEEFTKFRENAISIGPKVLTLDDIGIWFKFYLISMSFAILCFGIERKLYKKNYKQKVKRLYDTFKLNRKFKVLKVCVVLNFCKKVFRIKS